MDTNRADQNRGEYRGGLSVLAFLMLLLVLLAAVLFANAKTGGEETGRQNFFKALWDRVFEGNKASKSASSVFDLNCRDGSAVEAYGNYLVKYGSDSIRWLDKQGKESYWRMIPGVKPFLAKAGKRLLAVNMGGRDFYMFDETRLRWKKSVGGDILAVDVNGKGYVCVVHKKEGYQGAVQVYDPLGNWIYALAKADSFILSAKLLGSGQTLVLSTVNIKGARTDACLEFIDIRENRTIGSYAEENAIFPSVWPLEDGTVAALDHSRILGVNLRGEKEWSHDLGVISACLPCGDSKVVCVVGSGEGPNRNRSAIKTVDSRGDIKDIYTLEGSVEDMDAGDGVIAVNTGREVLFINDDGELLFKYSSNEDIDRVSLFNGREAAVVGRKKVSIVKIR